jgi:hypothetical protein
VVDPALGQLEPLPVSVDLRGKHKLPLHPHTLHCQELSHLLICGSGSKSKEGFEFLVLDRGVSLLDAFEDMLLP